MLIIAGYIDVDPADRAAFLAERQGAIAASTAEPGCIEYVFSADSSDSQRVRVFERWESAAELEVHLSARARQPQRDDAIAVRARELIRYEIASSGPLQP